MAKRLLEQQQNQLLDQQQQQHQKLFLEQQQQRQRTLQLLEYQTSLFETMLQQCTNEDKQYSFIHSLCCRKFHWSIFI